MTDFDMCCIPYRTQMLFSGCLRNQEVANGKGRAVDQRWKYGSLHREHCADCASGKWVAEHRNGHRMPVPNQGPKGKAVETKACKHPDCDSGSRPQPLENFKKHNAWSDGYDSVCKDCRAKGRKLQKGGCQKLPSKTGKGSGAEALDQVYVVVRRSGPCVYRPDEFNEIKDELDAGTKVMHCRVHGVFTVKKATVLEAV